MREPAFVAFPDDFSSLTVGHSRRSNPNLLIGQVPLHFHEAHLVWVIERLLGVSGVVRDLYIPKKRAEKPGVIAFAMIEPVNLVEILVNMLSRKVLFDGEGMWIGHTSEALESLKRRCFEKDTTPFLSFEWSHRYLASLNNGVEREVPASRFFSQPLPSAPAPVDNVSPVYTHSPYTFWPGQVVTADPTAVFNVRDGVVPTSRVP